MVLGQNVTIPANIGLPSGVWANRTLSVFGVNGTSPLRTEDSSGTIHILARIPVLFTLGDFFDVWGTKLTDSPIQCVQPGDYQSAYCANNGYKITVFVGNGGPLDPTTVPSRDVKLIAGTSVFIRIAAVP
jgi:hypothetical protein